MILFHVQHLLGSGHVQRVRLIAAELARRGAPVAVVCGGMPIASAAPEGVEWIQLEPIRAADMDFARLVDACGRPADEALFSRRAEALRAIVERLRPTVVVVESYPFGRRAFAAEIDTLLTHAASGRPAPLVVASIRDILHRRSARRDEETAARVVERFDAVLVHGDPAVVSLDASFGACAGIAARIVYTGYVAPPPVPRAAIATGDAEVVVSAGGGAAGRRLYEVALEAALTGFVARPWRLLVGSALDDEAFSALSRRAGGRVRVERNRDDFRDVLARAAALVSQAGYNTVCDVMVTGVPSLLVPFEGSGETEQLQRARRFADLGRCRFMREGELDAAVLTRRLEEILAAPGPIQPEIDLGGVDRSADWLLARM